MAKQDTWVIIPAYNEEKYIAEVLKKLKSVWLKFVVVDDGSSDQTFEIASKYSSHVLRHAVNLGKGAAIRTGCEYAISELNAKSLIFFDADDQHDPQYVPKIATALEKSPAVFGVRSFDNHMPLFRIMLNRAASVMVLFFFGKYIPDIPSGFKGLSAKTYKKLNLQSSQYEIEMEIAAKVAMFKVPFVEISIPTIYHDYDRGMTFLDILNMFEKLIAWRIKP